MTLAAYTDAPTFVIGSEISAPLLNDLASNAIIVDKLSRRGRRAFQGNAQPARLQQWPGVNPLWIWRGSFQFRTGLTTASFAIATNPISDGGTKTLRILFNGASVWSTTLTSSSQTHTPTVALSGYTDRQIVDVVVQVDFVTSPQNEGGSYQVLDANIGPYSAVTNAMYGSYPGTPTFGGTTITATQLNQLSNALDWLANRINVVPLPLFQNLRYQQTRDKPQTWNLWWGSITRTNGNDVLRCTLILERCENQAERFELLINGAIVATSPTYTTGQSALWYPGVSLAGYTPNTRLDLVLRSAVVTGTPYSPPRFTRISLQNVFTQESPRTAGTAPAQSAILESLTFSTLISRLNAISTLTSDAKARIDAASDVFDVCRMYRRRYVFNDGFDTGWASTQVPWDVRVGDVLWVRGRALDVAWGPITVADMSATDAQKANWSWETSEKTTVVPGDTLDTKQVFLDAMDGLFPGVSLFVRGKDCLYAAQELRAG